MNIGIYIFLANKTENLSERALRIQASLVIVKCGSGPAYSNDVVARLVKVVAFSIHWIPNFSPVVLAVSSSNKPLLSIWDSVTKNYVRMIIQLVRTVIITIDKLPALYPVDMVEIIA